MHHKLKRELRKLDNHSRDEIPVLSDDVVKWITQVRKIKGQKFSFCNRDYLIPLYRDNSDRIYVVKPRQMEITEYALNWLLFYLIKNPATVGLYISDRMDHTNVFANLRLRRSAIGESEILQKFVSGRGNEFSIPFGNSSILYMFSAWDNFGEARSLPVDFAVVDECQSMNMEALPVLSETLSKSKFHKLVCIGTGSEEGDDWWKLWHTGDQKEWDGESKSWIAKKPENFGHASSYHLGQYMASWISPDDIKTKRQEYTPRRFANEVEGWWYKGARKPLTDSLMENLYDRNISLLSPGEVDKNLGPLFLGVDWGGGTNAYTVPWIWQCLDDVIPRFRLVYVSKITEPSTEKQADMISRLMDDYEITQAVMDAGGGTRQVEKLSGRYGPRILRCNYMQRPEDPIEFVYSENRINLDRTWAIETVIDLIQRPESNSKFPNGIPRIVIPAKEMQKVEWIVDQFTCIESEYVNMSSGRKYIRYDNPQESPDDALHACVYAYCAFRARKGRRKPEFAVGGPRR